MIIPLWVKLFALGVVVMIIFGAGYKTGDVFVTASDAKQIEKLQGQVAGHNAEVAAAEKAARVEQATADKAEMDATNRRNRLAEQLVSDVQAENTKLALKNQALNHAIEVARHDKAGNDFLNMPIPASLGGVQPGVH